MTVEGGRVSCLQEQPHPILVDWALVVSPEVMYIYTRTFVLYILVYNTTILIYKILTKIRFNDLYYPQHDFC